MLFHKILRCIKRWLLHVLQGTSQPTAFGAFADGAVIGSNVEFVGPRDRFFIGRNVRIGDGARLVCTDGASTIVLGDATVIQPRALLETGPGGRIELGRNNTVNPYCVIYGHGGLTTGDYVRIAAHTVMIPANHVYDDPDVPIAKQGLKKQGIVIGRDVWIGAGCRVLDGVHVGDGSVLAAGAVVSRSVPPFAVVAGVPARILKMRHKLL